MLVQCSFLLISILVQFRSSLQSSQVSLFDYEDPFITRGNGAANVYDLQPVNPVVIEAARQPVIPLTEVSFATQRLSLFDNEPIALNEIRIATRKPAVQQRPRTEETQHNYGQFSTVRKTTENGQDTYRLHGQSEDGKNTQIIINLSNEPKSFLGLQDPPSISRDSALFREEVIGPPAPPPTVGPPAPPVTGTSNHYNNKLTTTPPSIHYGSPMQDSFPQLPQAEPTIFAPQAAPGLTNSYGAPIAQDPLPSYGVPQAPQAPPPSYGAPVQDPQPTYGVPQAPQAPPTSYGAPAQDPQPSYGVPQAPQAPLPSYSVPQAPQAQYGPPPAQDPQPSYGVPQAPVQDPQPSYGVPQAPVQDPQPSYGVPQAPPVQDPKPSYGPPPPPAQDEVQIQTQFVMPALTLSWQQPPIPQSDPVPPPKPSYDAPATQSDFNGVSGDVHYHVHVDELGDFQQLDEVFNEQTYGQQLSAPRAPQRQRQRQRQRPRSQRRPSRDPRYRRRRPAAAADPGLLNSDNLREWLNLKCFIWCYFNQAEFNENVRK